MFRSLTTKMLKDRCTDGTNMLAYLLQQTDEDTDMNQLLDGLKSRMDCEFTIFEGDTRAYTTVIQDGKRVVGTKLSSSLSSTILQQGQTYLGKATILDEEYLCSYVPTRDADGKVDGLIFAGISSAEANRQTFMTVIMSSLVSVGVIIVCIMIMTPYLKKTVSAPLAEITQVAKRLEKGDLGLASGEEIVIHVNSNDEVGDLAQIFRGTIQCLRSYIGEISSVLNSIANGDLTNNVQQDYVGDFTSIKRSLDNITSNLNNTMSQIKTSAEQVASGSDQVSNSAQSWPRGPPSRPAPWRNSPQPSTRLPQTPRRPPRPLGRPGSLWSRRVRSWASAWSMSPSSIRRWKKFLPPPRRFPRLSPPLRTSRSRPIS